MDSIANYEGSLLALTVASGGEFIIQNYIKRYKKYILQNYNFFHLGVGETTALCFTTITITRHR